MFSNKSYNKSVNFNRQSNPNEYLGDHSYFYPDNYYGPYFTPPPHQNVGYQNQRQVILQNTPQPFRERPNLMNEGGRRGAAYPRKFNQHPKIPKESKDRERPVSRVENKAYICPGCLAQFDCFLRGGRYIGKVPLILNCKHTICQECIHKCATSESVVCPACKNPSTLTRSHSIDNIADVFTPNFYVLGLIVWAKAHGTDIREVTLVPVNNLNDNKPSLDCFQVKANKQEICCFLSCNGIATLRCQDCNDIYCVDCCTRVHKSAKSLWTHKQTPISSDEFSCELAKCTEHNMDLEYFCNTCHLESCCYCLIDKHEGHDKDHLSKLNETEFNDYASCKEKVEHTLKRLVIAKTKIKELSNFNSSVAEKKICSYFMNLYAKLQFLEKNLRKETTHFQEARKAFGGLDEISLRLDSSIETLKQILAACEDTNSKKINLKALLKKLKETDNVPCYLVNEESEKLEPVQFVVDPVIENLEEYFKICKSKDAEYSLVSEDQLPPDYRIDPITESDIESTLSSIVQSVRTEGNRNRRKKNEDYKGLSDNEMVEVTHIESLEHFYVQQKKVQSRFRQMTNEIDNYIKMATMVERPQLNELYLTLYVTKNEKMWCRGRLNEIKNGETEPLYEIFFIDYGSTHTLDISKMRQITAGIAQRKPFAIQCELYNPTYVNWGKNAHVYMGKIINGKDVYMMVKSVNSGIHQVDLMVSCSDRGLTSIKDLLINTCKNALSASSESSLDSVMLRQVNYTHDYRVFSNSMAFEKNQEADVIIANVVDPHHIFIHMAAHSNSLKKMVNAMRIYYKRNRSNSFIPLEGSYVAVQLKDHIRGTWQRALIKKVDMNAETAYVLCVDWGINVSVPWSSLQLLTEQFTKLESQAILVKMAHIEPPQKAHAWPDRATVFLQNKFRSRETLRMVVYNPDPVEVALFEILLNMHICLNAQLVEENLADSTGKISQVLEWPIDMADQKGFSEEDGLVASLLKKVDESEDEGSDEEDEKNIRKNKIEIIKFVSPDLIYIKFFCLEDQEQQLHRELQIHYIKERATKESWKEDDSCVVEDTSFFVRGKILGKEGALYRVNIFDKGTERSYPIDKIYVYPNYFSKFPNVAYKSHLANIRPAGGDQWSKSSIEVLDSIFEKYKDLYMTKLTDKSESKSMPMELWYTKVKMGGALEASVVKYISINKALVKLGFAYNKQAEKPSTAGKTAASRSLTAKEPFDNDSEVKSLTLEETKSDTESHKCVDSSKKSIDWNLLMEEEERNTKKQQNDSPYHTCETEIRDWKAAFPIKHQEFQAWITCAETEGIIYLRDADLQDIYKQMENYIKEYFDNKPPKEEKHEWKPGQLCTISYNNYWYRGKVCAVNSPEDVNVMMIDFGSDHNVSSKTLFREILYPTIPAFASKVKLYGIYAKSGAWLSSDYETLLDIVTEYGKVVIRSSLDAEVPLADVYTDKGVHVNQVLVDKCPNLTRCANLDNSHSDDDTVVIEEEIEVEPLVLEGSTVDTTEFEYKMESLPDKGKLPMFVIAILAYNKVVLKKPSDGIDKRVSELSMSIQRYVEVQPPIENIVQGMPCICPYTEDGLTLWYRAKVYGVGGLDCGYIFVFFVDFGNVESVSVKEVKMMRPEWFDIPVPCHVATLNFELKTDNHLEYVFQDIRKLFGKTKIVEVVDSNPLTVNLLDDDDGTLSYQSLVSSGLLKINGD